MGWSINVRSSCSTVGIGSLGGNSWEVQEDMRVVKNYWSLNKDSLVHQVGLGCLKYTETFYLIQLRQSGVVGTL